MAKELLYKWNMQTSELKQCIEYAENTLHKLNLTFKDLQDIYIKLFS